VPLTIQRVPRGARHAPQILMQQLPRFKNNGFQIVIAKRGYGRKRIGFAEKKYFCFIHISNARQNKLAHHGFADGNVIALAKALQNVIPLKIFSQ
jgi:hypothetical protein